MKGRRGFEHMQNNLHSPLGSLTRLPQIMASVQPHLHFQWINCTFHRSFLKFLWKIRSVQAYTNLLKMGVNRKEMLCQVWKLIRDIILIIGIFKCEPGTDTDTAIGNHSWDLKPGSDDCIRCLFQTMLSGSLNGVGAEEEPEAVSSAGEGGGATQMERCRPQGQLFCRWKGC